MSQMRGLLAGEGKLDLFYHCVYYGHWYQYGPFDIGQTTENGLRHCVPSEPDPSKPQAAARTGPGENSLSNGSMMKITPMAVWAHQLSEEDLAEAVKQDVSFMHSREDMWHLCTAYCIVIGTLIKSAGQKKRA